MPVDVKTFVQDPYFVGKSFPDKSFWSYWLKVLEDVYPHPLLPSKYMEVILKGSIGTGKTTAGIVGTMYSMHRLLCLTNPHATYNLAPSTDIRFVLFNVTLDLAYDVLYNTVRNIFVDSPYFQDLKATIDEKSKDIILPKRIGVTLAAKESHVLGRAIFGGILDETNFSRSIARGNAKVYGSYIQTIGRMGSRFRDDLGRIPGQLFLISSEKDESDFLSDHVESIRKSQEEGKAEYQSTKIVDTVLWEVKKDVFHYSGTTFPVFVGNQTQSASILDDPTIINQYDESRIIHVPIEHEREFRMNLIEAIRDIAGISTISKFKFITNLQYLSDSLVLVNATRNDYIKLTFDDEDQIMDYININILKTYLHRNPFSPRAIHLDISLGGDAYGFAMGTIIGLKEVTRTEYITRVEDGRTFTSEPHINIELVLGLKKVGDTQLPLFKVRQLVMDLRDLGFPISLVTADGFQSADTLQLLKLKGFDTKLVSVDKTPQPYICLRTSIYEERFEAPYHPILERELKELRESSTGFDHSPSECVIGSTKIKLINGKDVSIQDLAESYLSYNINDPIYVPTVSKGRVTLGIAINPRLTRKNAETVIVSLSNGESVTCTPDHRFMLYDGFYKQAQDLNTKDRLRSLTLDSQIYPTNIESGQKEDTYDISVPGTENFFVSSGIALHNSKDLADACAAVTFNLTEGFRGGAFQFYSKEIEKSFRESTRGHGHNAFEEKYGVAFKDRAERFYQENTY